MDKRRMDNRRMDKKRMDKRRMNKKRMDGWMDGWKGAIMMMQSVVT